MNGIIGAFRIGEDIAVALDAASGDPAEVTAITARMKPAEVAGNQLALDHEAAGIALTVTPRESAENPGGWTLSLSAAATAALAPGLYGIDARLAFGAAVEITEQTAFIALTRAAVA